VTDDQCLHCVRLRPNLIGMVLADPGAVSFVGRFSTSLVHSTMRGKPSGAGLQIEVLDFYLTILKFIGSNLYL
jgi:hypothetical protein